MKKAFIYNTQRMQRFLVCTVVVCLCNTLIYAQSPGGVSTGLTSWFKANSSVAGNVDTAVGSTSVANWKSELGNFQVSQPTVSRQPTFQATATTIGSFNFNPFLQFSKAGNTVLYNTATTPDLAGNNGSLFMVVNTYNGVTDGNPSGLTYKANTYAYQFKPSFRVQSGDGIAGGTGDFYNWAPFPSGVPGYAEKAGIILSCKGVDKSTADLFFDARRNGDSIAVSHRYNQPADGYSYTPIIPTGLYMGSDGAAAGGQNMSCGLAEVISYDTYLTEEDQNKVETYLAVKYGITLTRGQSTTARDYAATNGSTIWNATANAGYSFNITGIGRDDNSVLLQKQSLSAHNNALVYIYNGTAGGNFPAANADNTIGISSDLSYLLIGDNGLANTLSDCAGNGYLNRMPRTWKVQKTGTGISTVTIAVDTGVLSANTKRLLVSADAGFSTFNSYPLTIANGKLYAEVTLNNNEFFTFATDSLQVAFTMVAPVCTSTSNGSITTVVTGGNAPYVYAWSPSGETTANITGKPAGTYTVTIMHGGCQITRSVTLAAPAPPLGPVATGATVCPGETATLTIQNPNAAYTYNWYTQSTGGTPQVTGSTVTVATTTLPATWYAEVQHGSCTSTRTPVVISQPAALATPLVIPVTVTPGSVTFQWQAVAGATGYQVSINGGAYISPSSGSMGTTHTVSGLQPLTTVTIHVIALGAKSCQNSTPGKATAKTLTDEIFIPNTFTPNGDGKNELFKVYGNVIAGLTMKVFNQWGEAIYETNSITAGWDGTHKGKLQPIGVYYYVIRIRLTDGTEVTRKGSVNLLH
ncbi:T9SS type B sorting domain-containing protein [Niastella caeni]|uniref:T9SS type B sorting domain-containing protein n=1 Tax=Niastella caeni TaxID=2569763 RepID=A0A4S8HVQ6_9BACT|nr:gliding motility-associated C-terminal domain-containing protein [Niastella caeni]THU39271.1 T9SS type B sorting domain-containing protein [Niastella caeni]